MKKRILYNTLTIIIAAVWIINGLFCKVLNLAPRHEQIVARILGNDYSHSLTILIGLSEIVMAIWILSKFKSRLNVIVQITVIGLMNILEYFLAPDLLLFGKINIIFAFVFVLFVYYNEFYLNKK